MGTSSKTKIFQIAGLVCLLFVSFWAYSTLSLRQTKTLLYEYAEKSTEVLQLSEDLSRSTNEYIQIQEQIRTNQSVELANLAESKLKDVRNSLQNLSVFLPQSHAVEQAFRALKQLESVASQSTPQEEARLTNTVKEIRTEGIENLQTSRSVFEDSIAKTLYGLPYLISLLTMMVIYGFYNVMRTKRFPRGTTTMTKKNQDTDSKANLSSVDKTSTARLTNVKRKVSFGNILVIDDEPATLEALQKQVGEFFTIEWFANTESALERLEEKRFDVVLYDLIPDDTDAETVGLLRKLHPSLEIYVMTVGEPFGEGVQACIEKGARGVVVKPISSMENLITEMRILLQHKHWASRKAS